MEKGVTKFFESPQIKRIKFESSKEVGDQQLRTASNVKTTNHNCIVNTDENRSKENPDFFLNHIKLETGSQKLSKSINLHINPTTKQVLNLDELKQKHSRNKGEKVEKSI